MRLLLLKYAVQIANINAALLKSPFIPLLLRGKIWLIPLFEKEGEGRFLKCCPNPVF
jgi:hypothetical protein